MISLERHHPAQRMHRYYYLTVERNLFGAWSLVRTWGRIGNLHFNGGLSWLEKIKPR